MGENYTQFRDCIDIAVKIAFVLLECNKEQLKQTIHVYNIIEVQKLSNQQKVDSIVPDFPGTDQYSLRVKQSSSKDDRDACNEVLFNINNTLAKSRELFYYRIDIIWEEIQSINNHQKVITWLKDKESSLNLLLKDKEIQNKNEIKNLPNQGLILRYGQG